MGFGTQEAVGRLSYIDEKAQEAREAAATWRGFEMVCAFVAVGSVIAGGVLGYQDLSAAGFVANNDFSSLYGVVTAGKQIAQETVKLWPWAVTAAIAEGVRGVCNKQKKSAEALERVYTFKSKPSDARYLKTQP